MPRPSRVEKVLEGLMRYLATEEWVAGDTLPPSRQLERELGVSHATMLRALRQAAEHQLLDVRPRRPVVVLPGASQHAGLLLADLARRREVRRLAVLFPSHLGPHEETPFFAELISAVRQEVAKVNMQVDIVEWPLLDQVPFARSLPGRGYSAAFAVGVRAEYLISLHLLRRQRFPVVVFNATIPELPLPSVNMDEYGAAQQIAALLAGHGHRNLCMVSLAFDRRVKGNRHRVDGWLDYLSASGLLKDCLMPVCFVPDRQDVLEYFGRIFGVPGRPTAIVFAYGDCCEWFLRHPAHRHMKIPDQVSIATFDPVRRRPEDSWCPPVTTIICDMDRTIQCVLEMVNKMLSGEVRLRSIRVPMKVDLTESIGPPPETALPPGGMPGRHPGHGHPHPPHTLPDNADKA